MCFLTCQFFSIQEHSTATSESIVTQHLSLARRKLIEAESRLKSLETKHEKLVNKNLDLTKDLAKVGCKC